MKERLFIQKAKERVNLEEFIRKHFANAKCGAIEVQHTPIVTRIIVYTTTPGMVIGAGGERIREMSEMLKREFKIENPQIDVQRINNPDINPAIVAQSIVAALEAGTNYKKLGNHYLQRIMEAGAVGCELVMSGKFAGERSRKERFAAGYLKKCGNTAERDVDKGFATVSSKLGSVGVTVKIMVRHSVLKLAEPPVEETAAAAPEGSE